MFSMLPKMDFVSSRVDSVTGGQTFEVRANGGDSELVTSSGALRFLLKRPWENRENRKWEFTLWEGQDLFHAKEETSQPALTLVRYSPSKCFGFGSASSCTQASAAGECLTPYVWPRLQQEFLIRLQAPQGVLADVVR